MGIVPERDMLDTVAMTAGLNIFRWLLGIKQARQALELYSQSIPVSAAVESELEPLAKLERFDASQHVVSLP